MGPRRVESIFLKTCPVSTRRASRSIASVTRRAASAGASARLSVSTTTTSRDRSAGAVPTITLTGPRPANIAPASQAPVRSSAMRVTGIANRAGSPQTVSQNPADEAAGSANRDPRDDPAERPLARGHGERAPRRRPWRACILAWMKRLVVALCLLAALPIPATGAEDPAAALSLMKPKPAQVAKNFQLNTPDNRSISLAEFKGKVVFLN